MTDRSNTDPQRMEKIVSLCKRRGFIFQSAELYGGLNGCWDYGPLGANFKFNVKMAWWKLAGKCVGNVFMDMHGFMRATSKCLIFHGAIVSGMP